MKTSAEIREEFLKFFEEKHKCTRVKSSSLVPDNPTILLTTAGMVQFVPYFLGLEQPPFNPPRATSCQKCARAGGKDSDIENVGRTPRHHTFFEMLGNFSFGDYFKKDIIPWAWEFVTVNLGLDKDRLWVTVFENDLESELIWQEAGVARERIIRKGAKDNFWGPPGPTGPCGPCSEIHYDLGEQYKCSDNCSIATCECDRWVEIWNLVFMENFMDEEGNLRPLNNKNVDTGMGLERISMVCQNVASTFETDLLTPILNCVCKLTNKKYKADEKTDVSLRIITDHARCVTFMIDDGIEPSNEARGYVLRMILRRALRHGTLLGLKLPFMKPVIETVIENYKEAYPELAKNKAKILKVVKAEEERFKATIEKGYKQIESIIKNLGDGKIISGEDCFKLYDTYGFPLELTKEIAQEQGLSVNEKEFKILMEKQKELARSSVQKVVLTNDLAYAKQKETEFLGYDEKICEAQVLAVIKDYKEIKKSDEDDEVDIILDKTVCYGESGGQIGDNGKILLGNKILPVLNTFRVGKVFVHRIKGAISKGDKVHIKYSFKRRKEIEKHHSLAHLLQAALQKTFGKTVHQAGSYVEPVRCRYDISLDRAMTDSEIRQVENQINEWITNGLECKIETMSLEDAKMRGAMALFNEKYDKNVRVVSFVSGNETISQELCGGTHVKNAKELRLAKIVSESAIAAGTRRIEALCSISALNYLNEKSDLVDKISKKYKMKPCEIEQRFEKLLEENKNLAQKIKDIEEENAKKKFDTFVSKAKDIVVRGQIGKIFISKIEDIAPNAIKASLDVMAPKLGDEYIIIVCSLKPNDEVFVMAKISDGFVKTGLNAGKIVGALTKSLGGAGGGNFKVAQGVGKTQKGLDEILARLEKSMAFV